jgi:hypothetical protein
MTIRIAAALAAGFAIATLAACASPGGPKRLTDQQVCLEHHKGDAAEEDRCRLSPDLQRGAPPEGSAHDLPIRTDEPSG